jgi:hypothetical protein
MTEANLKLSGMMISAGFYGSSLGAQLHDVLAAYKEALEKRVERHPAGAAVSPDTSLQALKEQLSVLREECKAGATRALSLQVRGNSHW